MTAKSGIDPKGLKNFRPDRRRYNDPDETEGRALYRYLAELQARRDFWMTRRIVHRPEETNE